MYVRSQNTNEEPSLRSVKPILVRHWVIRRPFATTGEKKIEFVMHETYPSELNPYIDSTKK
jgi:hypothetical protein